MFDRIRTPLITLLLIAADVARSQEPSPAVCRLAPQLESIETAWGGLVLDPRVDPSEAGFAQLLTFRIPESGREGRAIFVRLTARDGSASLFRGERRDWALVAELDDGSLTWVYRYRDGQRLPDNWTYVPERRRVQRVEQRDDSEADPFEQLCRALGYAGLGRRVVVTGRSNASVSEVGQLRRTIDINRLTSCR